MLQQEKPDTYIVATGETHTVRGFVEAAFKHVDREIEWEGTGEKEIGKEVKTGIVRVRVNPKFYRPTEVEHYVNVGDTSRTKKLLGWSPSIKFEELVKEMLDSDLVLMKSDPYA